MLRIPDSIAFVGFVRKETHTRFGAYLSTGLDVRPAPLTDEDPAIVFSDRRPHSLTLTAL